MAKKANNQQFSEWNRFLLNKERRAFLINEVAKLFTSQKDALDKEHSTLISAAVQKYLDNLPEAVKDEVAAIHKGDKNVAESWVRDDWATTVYVMLSAKEQASDSSRRTFATYGYRTSGTDVTNKFGIYGSRNGHVLALPDKIKLNKTDSIGRALLKNDASRDALDERKRTTLGNARTLLSSVRNVGQLLRANPAMAEFIPEDWREAAVDTNKEVAPINVAEFNNLIKAQQAMNRLIPKEGKE